MISMKIENGNPQMRHFCLICLLLCLIPLGAQSPESLLKMPGSKGQAFPLFMATQALPSEQRLAETAVSLASFPSAESLSGDGIIAESDRNLLYVPPPDTGGGPLGTPVRDATPFLAALVILYGIIFRIRNSNPKNKMQ
jgi:hypothetical protein